LFADERCSKTILDFLATTDVSKTAGPPVAAAEEAGSDISAWERIELEEHFAQVVEEDARLGGEE